MSASIQQVQHMGTPLTPSTSRPSFSMRWRLDHQLLLMTFPAIVVLVVFLYVPLLGSALAFFDYVPWAPLSQQKFVGWGNFAELFSEPTFWRALRNTLVITAIQLVLFFPIPILLAVFLHSMLRPWLRALTQAVLYLPHFLSWVIVVGFFQQIIGGSGVINQLLLRNDLDPIGFMTNPGTFPLLVTSQVIWKDAGWGAIIFLSALSAIDENLYEAAAIDGAGALRRFWHVTIPGILPIIILLLILRLGDALNVGFEQILLQRDAVGPAAGEVLDTFVYYNGIVGQNFSTGIAAGLFKGVIGLILILGANKIAHLLGQEGVYSRGQ